MADNNSIIREINLRAPINMSTNKSTVVDFNGFNKKTGVMFNETLSNIYNKKYDSSGQQVVTISENTYSIKDGCLYNNSELLIDYNDNYKVDAEIKTEFDKNTLAYYPNTAVVYVDGNNIIIKSLTDNTEQTLEIEDSSLDVILTVYQNNFVVFYNNKVVSYFNGQWKSITLTSSKCAIFKDDVYVVMQHDSTNNRCVWYKLYAGENYYTNFEKFSLTNGSYSVKNATLDFEYIQSGYNEVAGIIKNITLDSDATVSTYYNTKLRYLKCIKIDGTLNYKEFYSSYAPDRDEYNLSSITSSNITANTSSYSLASFKSSRFLRYNSFIASNVAIASGNSNVTNKSGIILSFIESINSDIESISFSNNSVTGFIIEDLKNYPALLGYKNNENIPLFNRVKYGNFILHYYNDALIGISHVSGECLLIPWNDVDESKITIGENTFTYYSENNKCWVEINVTKENPVVIKNIAQKLATNVISNKNACKDNELFNYSSCFTPAIPRETTFCYVGYHDINNRNRYFDNLITNINDNSVVFYASFGRGTNFTSMLDVGPIWSSNNYYTFTDKAVNTINWDKSFNVPKVSPAFPKDAYSRVNLTINSNSNFTYTLDKDSEYMLYANTTFTNLIYYNSWKNGKFYINNSLLNTEKSITDTTYYTLPTCLDVMTFIDSINGVGYIKMLNTTWMLLVIESNITLLTTLLSTLNNVSDYFILQGIPFGIINGYINRITYNNYNISSQEQIISVENMKFLGNTDKEAYFFAPMNKCIYAFTADNTLSYFAAATILNENTTTIFDKQTKTIFILLNDKTIALSDQNSMFEIDNRSEYFSFGKNTFSDEHNVYAWYKVDDEFKPNPIKLETMWYGDIVNRKNMNVDTIYIELYDEERKASNFKISLDSLVNNTINVKEKEIKILSSEWDKTTNTYYLRYQPRIQLAAAFRLRITSDSAIKRIAVGYKVENNTISKNNI